MQPLSQYFCSFSREIISWNIQHVLKSSIPTIPYFCSAAFAIRIRQALNIAPIGSSRLKINSLTMPLLFLFLENGTATHSSILAWRIPWTEEPGKLQSMGSQRVRHDWGTNIFHPKSVCVCVWFATLLLSGLILKRVMISTWICWPWSTPHLLFL